MLGLVESEGRAFPYPSLSAGDSAIDPMAATSFIRRLHGWARCEMAKFGKSRLVAFVSALLAGVVVTNLIWVPFSTVYLNKSIWFDVAMTMPMALLWLLLGTMRLQLRKTPFRYRDMVSEFAGRIQALAMALTAITLFSLVLLLITYLATATSRPLLDSYLAAGDASLGFNWVAYVRLLNGYPSIDYVLSIAYNSLSIQLLLLPAILALSARSHRLEEFVAHYGVAGCLMCLVTMAVPAAGAFEFYHPSPDILSSFGPGASVRYLEQLHALRTLKPFLLEHPEGLVSFPSFHSTLAAIFAYSMRGIRYISLPVYALNAMLILATFPEGGHYLVDVLAGLAVAAVAIQFVRWIAQVRPPLQSNSDVARRSPGRQQVPLS
ncbi:phosphatase PAP2 family protein [Mesorhizobium sp. ESP7-2]|uniref:phosphatase PAP2 family protein n=1 Tax=Mesorhizobium sp. ESP7-2 TaxID=2876622 RepID=UPI001CCA73DA|nr:phosphatase PAP2 family protein [Mesorhizobium sp. ESP7-2]MBZ9708154.1 phosphatase PAP2 family protein [Mesorhizobium sp. ESP7-2]